MLEDLPFQSALDTRDPIDWSQREFTSRTFRGTIHAFFLHTLGEETPFTHRQEEMVLSAIHMIWHLLRSLLPEMKTSLAQTNSSHTLKEHAFTLMTNPTQEKASLLPEMREILTSYLKIDALTGILDCLIEIDDKLYLFDWKTNFLGNEPSDYRQDQLALAMVENHYGLQYHLYILTLKAWYTRHKADIPFQDVFGGTFYLFTRAFLNAPQEEHGIFWVPPDWQVLEALTVFFSPLELSGEDL